MNVLTSEVWELNVAPDHLDKIVYKMVELHFKEAVVLPEDAFVNMVLTKTAKNYHFAENFMEEIDSAAPSLLPMTASTSTCTNTSTNISMEENIIDITGCNPGCSKSGGEGAGGHVKVTSPPTASRSPCPCPSSPHVCTTTVLRSPPLRKVRRYNTYSEGHRSHSPVTPMEPLHIAATQPQPTTCTSTRGPFGLCEWKKTSCSSSSGHDYAELAMSSSHSRVCKADGMSPPSGHTPTHTSPLIPSGKEINLEDLSPAAIDNMFYLTADVYAGHYKEDTS